MANILLISYFFPPHNSIACRRVYAWAKYLQGNGHSVTVLAADIPCEKTVKSYDIDTSFLTVYRLKYFDPRSLITNFYKTEDLFKDNIGGSSWFNKWLVKNIMNIVCFFSERGVLSGCTRFPAFFEAWGLTAYVKAKELINKQDINVVITSSPPPTSNIIGLFLKRKFKNILWIADYRDLWTQNHLHKGLFPFTLLENFFEKRCILNSDMLITVSSKLKDLLGAKYPDSAKDMICIENGYDEAELADIPNEACGNGANKKVLVFSGSLYRERSFASLLLLPKLIESNLQFWQNNLEIIFYGGYDTQRFLNELFRMHPAVNSVIRYGGFLSMKDCLRQQQRADALLFIECDKKNDGVFTGKIFEYMMFKKPIICLGITKVSSIGRLLEKTGLCFFCGTDIIVLEETLQMFLKNEIKVNPNNEYIAQFSRKKQVAFLSGVINNWFLNKKNI